MSGRKKFKNVPVSVSTFETLEKMKVNCESWDDLIIRMIEGID